MACGYDQEPAQCELNANAMKLSKGASSRMLYSHFVTGQGFQVCNGGVTIEMLLRPSQKLCTCASSFSPWFCCSSLARGEGAGVPVACDISSWRCIIFGWLEPRYSRYICRNQPVQPSCCLSQAKRGGLGGGYRVRLLHVRQLRHRNRVSPAFRLPHADGHPCVCLWIRRGRRGDRALERTALIRCGRRGGSKPE
jgi:hypothetical protein